MSRPAICDYASALEFLLACVNYERTTVIPYRAGAFKLDRMRRLMGLLGDPHLGLAAIHIAGTKGKGSTAAMLAAILTAAGRRTGLYTSPHLDAIEERIAIDGRICSQADFVRLAAELAEAVARLPADASDPEASEPTFFEVTTAMAFLHYSQQNVDAVVLEVGLGGRLDSTNVCRPSVSIITSISFDHTRQLGNTLAAIAGEKAGIIKPGVPVISGVVEGEPRSVIQETARREGAPLFERDVQFDFDYRDERAHYREPADGSRRRMDDLQLGMLGRHQAANAATALAAISRLNEQGWNIPEAAIRRGLAEARCPARIEVVSQQPTVVLDVAHNVASIEALVHVLAERFPAGRRVLVFASSRDKDTARHVAAAHAAVRRSRADAVCHQPASRRARNPANDRPRGPVNCCERRRLEAKAGAAHGREPRTGVGFGPAIGGARRPDLHHRLVLSGRRVASAGLASQTGATRGQPALASPPFARPGLSCPAGFASVSP